MFTSAITEVCERCVKFFGKDRLIYDITTGDFEEFRSAIAKTRGPVALGNNIARVRILFKWGFDSGLVDKPMRYGQGFNRPSKAVVRKKRAANGVSMFDAAQIAAMLKKAPMPLKAMIRVWTMFLQ